MYFLFAMTIKRRGKSQSWVNIVEVLQPGTITEKARQLCSRATARNAKHISDAGYIGPDNFHHSGSRLLACMVAVQSTTGRPQHDVGNHLGPYSGHVSLASLWC